MKDANGHGANPMLLTAQVMDNLETAFRVGAVVADAAAYAGVNERTLRWWIAQGQKPDCDPLYRELAERLYEAKGAGNVQSLGVLATSDDWRAHRARLAMQRPEYAERRHVTGEIRHEHTISIDPARLAALSDDDLEALEQLLPKLRPTVIEGELVAESDA